MPRQHNGSSGVSCVCVRLAFSCRTSLLCVDVAQKFYFVFPIGIGDFSDWKLSLTCRRPLSLCVRCSAQQRYAEAAKVRAEVQGLRDCMRKHFPVVRGHVEAEVGQKIVETGGLSSSSSVPALQ